MEMFVSMMFFMVLATLVLMLFIGFAVYFIPIIIAFVRKHNNFVPICLLNIFAGWTFLGWLASLLWALNSDVNKAQNDDDDDE